MPELTMCSTRLHVAHVGEVALASGRPTAPSVPSGIHPLWVSASSAWGARDGWLLVHLDDRVLWCAVPAGAVAGLLDTLPVDRVQTLRLFSIDLELRGWRAEGRLQLVSVAERAGEDEANGDVFAATQDQRYLLADGEGRPELGTYLAVRHFYAHDPDTGLLRLAEHRWLAVDGGAP